MLSDEELDQVAPFVAQMIEDRLRERLGWIVAASGLNVGETDGAQDGEIRASGAVRTRSGLSMGGAELSAPASVLAGVELAAQVVNPAAGARFVYPKADGWYERDSAGVESRLASEGLWTNYSAISTVGGWGAFTTKDLYYKRIGKVVLVSFRFIGTSNSVGVSFTLPYSSAGMTIDVLARAVDNSGAWGAGLIQLPIGTSTVAGFSTPGAAGWTAANTKGLEGQFWYVTA